MVADNWAGEITLADPTVAEERLSTRIEALTGRARPTIVPSGVLARGELERLDDRV
jgi:hypothetical protein